MTVEADLLNGAAALKTPFRPNPELVRMADEIKAAVMAGAFTSLAVVAIGAGGQMTWSQLGPNLAELCIGAELMRDDIKAAMRGKPSKIIRPGG